METRDTTQQSPNHPYRVPEGYFEGLKANVFAKIKEENIIPEPKLQPLPQPKHWYQRSATYIYAAAALAGLAILVRFVPLQTRQESDLSALDRISPELYEQFLLEETADEYWSTTLLDLESEQKEWENHL
ncbi:MAG: hypothetical protein Q4D93_03065 [Porphyromonas sp.]|nr:hypothetical protein [Porphyromonas sp.]